MTQPVLSDLCGLAQHFLLPALCLAGPIVLLKAIAVTVVVRAMCAGKGPQEHV
jgi:hypothetical protein